MKLFSIVLVVELKCGGAARTHHALVKSESEAEALGQFVKWALEQDGGARIQWSDVIDVAEAEAAAKAEKP